VGFRPAENGVAGHFFRANFVDVGIFRLLDEEYPVVPLIQEILRIHHLPETMSFNAGRLNTERGGHDA